MTLKRRHKDSLTSLLFVLPLLVLFLIFFAYPIIYNIIISFYDWNGISLTKVFNGFTNYKNLLADPVMWKAFKNFIIIAVSTTLIQSAIGIILASFFMRKIKFSGFYRILFYLPAICTPTIVGTVFSKIFETNRGYLNVILRALNLDFLCQPWLATPDTALVCLIFVNIWQWTGYSMLMYYTNMLNIPRDLYESATIDGAGRLQQTIHVTLPGISITIVMLAVLSLGGIMNAGFEQILVMYNPAVYRTGDILDTFIYRQGLLDAQYSLSTAIGLFKSVIGLILMLTANGLASKYANYRIF